MNDKHTMHSTQIIGIGKREQSNQKRRNIYQITQDSCREVKNIVFQIERSHYIVPVSTRRRVNLKFQNTGNYPTTFQKKKTGHIQRTKIRMASD